MGQAKEQNAETRSEIRSSLGKSCKEGETFLVSQRPILVFAEDANCLFAVFASEFNVAKNLLNGGDFVLGDDAIRFCKFGQDGDCKENRFGGKLLDFRFFSWVGRCGGLVKHFVDVFPQPPSAVAKSE